LKRRQSHPNPPVNHVAISVPDIEAAVKWYTEVLGFRKLRQSVRYSDRKVTPEANLFKIYGDRLQKVKIAFLTSGNGVGIELFQFIDPPMKPTAVSIMQLAAYFTYV
jgi:catechol 2,3-dioxygenase-like lactoylglutathione lyase family enzyme